MQAQRTAVSAPSRLAISTFSAFPFRRRTNSSAPQSPCFNLNIAHNCQLFFFETAAVRTTFSNSSHSGPEV
jgi:hypothetical protein